MPDSALLADLSRDLSKKAKFSQRLAG